MTKYRIGAGLAVLVTAVFAGGCGLLNSSTPAKVFSAYYEAAKKKDVAGMKKTMSKASVEMMEKRAKDASRSLDDLMKDDSYTKDTPDKVPETRNEKIDGDNATLEIKNDKTNDWLTMPFVKEDGEWKIALDKLVEEMMKKVKEKTSGTP